MGFWQGVASAYKDIGAERTREKELEEERAFEQEKLMTTLKENRRNALFELLARRKAAEGDASQYAAKTEALARRFEGVDDERVKVLLSNPITAATVYDNIVEIEAGRAKNDIAARLSGVEILNNLTIYGGSGGIKPAEYTLEDIDAADLSDNKLYDEMRLGLSVPTGATAPVVEVSPELLRPYGEKRLETARDTFSASVIQIAAQEAERLRQAGDERADEFASLSQAIEDVRKNGTKGIGMADLMTRFGVQVYEGLEAQGSPYLTALSEIPELQPVVAIAKLKYVAENAPDEERRQRAIDALRAYGVEF